MMQSTAYRLAEYKIIENGHGDLWWETHIGLGSLKSGKCFIIGDILFIKPDDHTGPGFLKGEFLDHLNRLTKWEKTKYFCTSYKIYKCKSGSRKPIFEEMNGRLRKEATLRENRSTQKEVAKTTRKSVKADTAAHISYKLHRYEITEKNDGQLFWKSYSGLSSSKRGRCHVKGNILFLEPGETQLPGPMKRAFLQQLIHLPDWQKTKYFCTIHAIYYSKTGAICRRLEEDKDLKGEKPKNVAVGNKPAFAGIIITPMMLANIIAKDKFKTFLNFIKTWVLPIPKLLFGCFQIGYNVSRVLIDKWTRFRG